MKKTTDITEEKLLTSLDNLHKKQNDLKAKVNNLKQLKKENKIITDYQETSSITEDKNEPFLEEINFYYENLKGCTTEEEINQFLPSNTNPNYTDILLVLKLKVLRDIRSINELINEDLSKDDLTIIKEEIANEKAKITLIDTHISPNNNNESTRVVKVK